jgi:hypothetical protein
MVPVSEEHPLYKCRHYVSAVAMPESLAGASGMQGYYNVLGMVLLGTVVDGDCGLDVACQMLGLPQLREARKTLRQELPVTRA